jgi:Polyketide cyclase / dehydrase and lipid transport
VSQVQESGRLEVIVRADIRDVWRVVSDVTRIGEWSPECRSARWLGGACVVAPGVRFRGRNRAGWLRWSRTAEMVAVEESRELVWRTVPTWRYPDSTQWRIKLAPTAQGTAITESFTVLRAPWLLDRLYARLIPSHQNRDARLADDLHRLGAVASRSAET